VAAGNLCTGVEFNGAPPCNEWGSSCSCSVSEIGAGAERAILAGPKYRKVKDLIIPS
jgi:hypothetical protein